MQFDVYAETLHQGEAYPVMAALVPTNPYRKAHG